MSLKPEAHKLVARKDENEEGDYDRKILHELVTQIGRDAFEA